LECIFKFELIIKSFNRLQHFTTIYWNILPCTVGNIMLIYKHKSLFLCYFGGLNIYRYLAFNIKKSTSQNSILLTFNLLWNTKWNFILLLFKKTNKWENYFLLFHCHTVTLVLESWLIKLKVYNIFFFIEINSRASRGNSEACRMNSFKSLLKLFLWRKEAGTIRLFFWVDERRTLNVKE
jgi:hypothetical protein